MLWSKPENRQSAGKLLIIGGQKENFSLPSKAYEYALSAGAGTVRTLLPDSLQKIANLLPGVEFAPSNKSGSFARSALGEWFDLSNWADHTLLAGDLGKNSETTTIIDGFLLKSSQITTVTLDALKSTGITLDQLIDMPLTLIVDFATIQKIAIVAKQPTAIQSTTPIAQQAEILHRISSQQKATLVVQSPFHIWVADNGKVSSTNTNKPIDPTKLSASCAVWQMQNPHKRFEALTTASYEASRTNL